MIKNSKDECNLPSRSILIRYKPRETLHGKINDEIVHLLLISFTFIGKLNINIAVKAFQYFYHSEIAVLVHSCISTCKGLFAYRYGQKYGLFDLNLGCVFFIHLVESLDKCTEISVLMRCCLAILVLHNLKYADIR